MTSTAATIEPFAHPYFDSGVVGICIVCGKTPCVKFCPKCAMAWCANKYCKKRKDSIEFHDDQCPRMEASAIIPRLRKLMTAVPGEQPDEALVMAAVNQMKYHINGPERTEAFTLYLNLMREKGMELPPEMQKRLLSQGIPSMMTKGPEMAIIALFTMLFDVDKRIENEAAVYYLFSVLRSHVAQTKKTLNGLTADGRRESCNDMTINSRLLMLPHRFDKALSPEMIPGRYSVLAQTIFPLTVIQNDMKHRGLNTAYLINLLHVDDSDHQKLPASHSFLLRLVFESKLEKQSDGSEKEMGDPAMQVIQSHFNHYSIADWLDGFRPDAENTFETRSAEALAKKIVVLEADNTFHGKVTGFVAISSFVNVIQDLIDPKATAEERHKSYATVTGVHLPYLPGMFRIVFVRVNFMV